eukprot:gene16066-18347_t
MSDISPSKSFILPGINNSSGHNLNNLHNLSNKNLRDNFSSIGGSSSSRTRDRAYSIDSSADSDGAPSISLHGPRYTAAEVALSSRQLQHLFPYHISVDKDFNVVQMGEKLYPLVRSIISPSSNKKRINQHISKYFKIISPAPVVNNWDAKMLANLQVYSPSSAGLVEIELVSPRSSHSHSQHRFGEEAMQLQAQRLLLRGRFHELCSFSSSLHVYSSSQAIHEDMEEDGSQSSDKINNNADYPGGVYLFLLHSAGSPDETWANSPFAHMTPLSGSGSDKHFVPSSPISSPAIRRDSMDASAQEIARLMSANAALMAENERLKEENTGKDVRGMLGNVAHDLKTPLAAFMGAVELVKDIAKDCEDLLHKELLSKAESTATKENGAAKEDTKKTRAALKELRKSVQLISQQATGCLAESAERANILLNSTPTTGSHKNEAQVPTENIMGPLSAKQVLVIHNQRQDRAVNTSPAHPSHRHSIGSSKDALSRKHRSGSVGNNTPVSTSTRRATQAPISSSTTSSNKVLSPVLPHRATIASSGDASAMVEAASKNSLGFMVSQPISIPAYAGSPPRNHKVPLPPTSSGAYAVSPTAASGEKREGPSPRGMSGRMESRPRAGTSTDPLFQTPKEEDEDYLSSSPSQHGSGSVTPKSTAAPLSPLAAHFNINHQANGSYGSHVLSNAPRVAASPTNHHNHHHHGGLISTAIGNAMGLIKGTTGRLRGAAGGSSASHSRNHSQSTSQSQSLAGSRSQSLDVPDNASTTSAGGGSLPGHSSQPLGKLRRISKAEKMRCSVRAGETDSYDDTQQLQDDIEAMAMRGSFSSDCEAEEGDRPSICSEYSRPDSRQVSTDSRHSLRYSGRDSDLLPTTKSFDDVDEESAKATLSQHHMLYPSTTSVAYSPSSYSYLANNHLLPATPVEVFPQSSGGLFANKPIQKIQTNTSAATASDRASRHHATSPNNHHHHTSSAAAAALTPLLLGSSRLEDLILPAPLTARGNSDVNHQYNNSNTNSNTNNINSNSIHNPTNSNDINISINNKSSHHLEAVAEKDLSSSTKSIADPEPAYESAPHSLHCSSKSSSSLRSSNGSVPAFNPAVFMHNMSNTTYQNHNNFHSHTHGHGQDSPGHSVATANDSPATTSAVIANTQSDTNNTITNSSRPMHFLLRLREIEAEQYHNYSHMTTTSPSMSAKSLQLAHPELPPRRQIVVCLSANGDEETVNDAYNAGVDGYIEKPFSLQKLQEAMQEIHMDALDDGVGGV